MAAWMIGSVHGLLLVGTAFAVQGGSSSAGAEDPRSKFEPSVLESAARGETTVWVLMRPKANLAAALEIKDDVERGAFVYRTLREVAGRSQAGLRAELDQRGVDYKTFWIVNAIRVAAGESLLLEIAARSDVKAIHADRVFQIPPVRPGHEEPRIDTIEWNIERIRADKVWSRFNVRGQDIVVANIDTGVQYDHPALVRQYRGNRAGGNFDHNFNWADPSGGCGNSNVPCDNNSHGTHTMGTMVGDDGTPGPNQIGVAPDAKWIACKACAVNLCAVQALAACGQWMLAPTDLAGNNASPAKRPHVVNSSWTHFQGNGFYRAIVDAWIASGIFPAFANGNAGPGCGTSGSPGDYIASYSAGAFAITNAIASFSGRGPSPFGSGELKPNVAAPGVNVRSSVPLNNYASGTGTSMASPHVAGTVALIWSRSRTVRRDIAATRLLLDNAAKDVSDLTCGGTTDDNNVWGEGRLDALTAVSAAPLP